MKLHRKAKLKFSDVHHRLPKTFMLDDMTANASSEVIPMERQNCIYEIKSSLQQECMVSTPVI